MEKDEELGLVTLEEMYNCFKSDEYKEFREDFDVSFVVDENGKESVSYIYAWDLPENSPLLYRHIVAEQLFRTDYRLVNWEYMSAFSEATFYGLMDLMLNPLVWQDKRLYYDSLIEGRIAKEEFDRSRLHRVWEIMYYIREEGILNFADNPYVFDEDLIGANYIKGMHDWGVITTDYGEIMKNIYQGARFTYSDLSKNKYYDIKKLRTSILKIAEERGGKRAAEILNTLQKEWPKIKRWKTHFESMTNDDISQFEDILMNGFETELEEWEAGNDAPKEQPKTVKRAKNQSVSKSQSFETLLQCPQDQKEHVMSRLHELLDNKGGKHVAMILMAAKQKYFLLLDTPTEKQYTAEFTLNGTWRAVSDYIQKHTLPSGKYSEDLDHISIL